MSCLLLEIFIFRILAVSLDSIKIACARTRRKGRRGISLRRRREPWISRLFWTWKWKLFDPAVVRAVHWKDREQSSVGNNLAPVARRTAALSVNERLSRKLGWVQVEAGEVVERNLRLPSFWTSKKSLNLPWSASWKDRPPTNWTFHNYFQYFFANVFSCFPIIF